MVIDGGGEEENHRIEFSSNSIQLSILQSSSFRLTAVSALLALSSVLLEFKVSGFVFTSLRFRAIKRYRI
jgi:hypothetical protein